MKRFLFYTYLLILSLVCTHAAASTSYTISINNTKLPLEFNNNGRGLKVEKTKNHMIILFDTQSQSIKNSLTMAGIDINTKICGNIEYLKKHCSCLGGGNHITIRSGKTIEKSYISTVPIENLDSSFAICRKS